MPTTTMDGSEQTLFENTELGAYSGYIFLNNVQSGDTILFTCYINDVEAGVYRIREQKQITGAQTYTALEVRELIGKSGIKITAKQTGGTYRVLDHMWFKR
jgi:hypothetical protein